MLGIHTSPCVVGNLWDVTDVDIDKFAKQMLELWIGTPEGDEDDEDPSSSEREKRIRSLPMAIMHSRSACKLQHINGCAPVCYGLPVVVGR